MDTKAFEDLIQNGESVNRVAQAFVYSPCLRLLDFKTTRKLPDPKKGGAWLEHRLQLAAYAQSAQRDNGPITKIKSSNLYISTETPGQFIICEHEDWQGTYERGFLSLLKYWQWEHNYYPTV